MDTSIEELKNEMGKKWIIFNKIHNIFLTIDKNVNFRIFPIYIVYSRGENVFGVIFFKGKLIKNENLIVGLKFNSEPNLHYFKEASEIKYAGINYYISIKNNEDLNKEIITSLKELT
jgi:hypothetical protein